MPSDTPTYDLTCLQTAATGDPVAPRADGDANAYLIVHVDSSAVTRQGGRIGETPLQRLRALYWSGPDRARRAPLALTLADRLGNELLSLADADPTLGVALRPGTYHLTATQGGTRRGYTVSLPAGTRFDLHLRFPAQDPLRSQALATTSDRLFARSTH